MGRCEKTTENGAFLKFFVFCSPDFNSNMQEFRVGPFQFVLAGVESPELDPGIGLSMSLVDCMRQHNYMVKNQKLSFRWQLKYLGGQ